MTFNTFTSTNKMTLYVEDAKNRVIAVPYHLVIRAYATKTMIEETLTHFRFAAALMAAGIEWSHDIPRCAELESAENWHRGEPMPTEAAVQIFTNEFPVWSPQANGCVKIPLNIFTEYTSAFEVWDTMSLIVDMLPGIRAIDETLKPKQVKPQQPARHEPSQFKSHEPTPQGEDLDEWFSRESDCGREPTPEEPHIHLQPATDDEGFQVIEWDNRQRETYETKYAGQKVRVAVAKLQRAVRAKKDGTGTFEAVEVFPAYQGGVSQYEAYAFKTFISDKDTAWDWKKYRDHKVTGQLLTAPGTTCTARMWLTFKVNQGKDGKVYWNLYGIDLLEEPSEWAEFGTATECTPAEEIPWNDAPPVPKGDTEF